MKAGWTLDSEISIPRYQVFHKDRNWYGVEFLSMLMSSWTAVQLIIYLLTWNYCGSQYIVAISDWLTLGTFHCPPKTPVDILDELQNSLQNIERSHFNNLVLLSNFNVDFGSSTDSLSTKLENTMSTFMLKEMMTEPTHFHSGVASMIDLHGVCF